MSDLAARLRALRGDDATRDGTERDGTEPDGSVRDGAAQDGSQRERGTHAVGAPPVGARPVPPPSPEALEAIAYRLRGEAVHGPDGTHLRLVHRVPAGVPYGTHPVDPPADDPAAGPVAYLDAETTGLAGGTGTFAFLVAFAVHATDGLEVRLAFAPGPQHERALLTAVAGWVRDAGTVVTYNGASFDLPLLRTRARLHRLPDPFAGREHLDLLPWARRLWRTSLPSCTLSEVERSILGVRRSRADVPGAEVPSRYRSFLSNLEVAPLEGVISHARDDVVALAALRRRVHAARAWAEHGGGEPVGGASERHGLGRALEASGRTDAALRCYLAAEAERPEAAWDAARLLRRTGRVEEAVARWHRLAAEDDPRAWIELAKHHEHRRRDVVGALRAVAQAERTGGARLDDLDYRRARLEAKRAGPG